MVDDELESYAHEYAGLDFRQPKKVVIETFKEYGEETWTPTEFLALVAKAIVDIPPDAEQAVVKLDHDTPTLTVSYVGLESEAVVDARIKRALTWAANKLEADRITYQRLKAKFDK